MKKQKSQTATPNSLCLLAGARRNEEEARRHGGGGPEAQGRG